MNKDTPPSSRLTDRLATGSRDYFPGKVIGQPDRPDQVLRYVALVFAAFWALDLVLAHLVPPGRVARAADALDAVAIALAAAVVGLSFARLRRNQLLAWGLGFEVLGALTIALGDLGVPIRPDTPVIGVSWVCLWVAIFPLFLPSTLGWSVLASVAAASMGPLVYLVSVATGRSLLPGSKLLELYLPNYLAAGSSFFPIYVMNRLAREIKKAQRLGSYELLERLGEGGMGEVWTARHALLARSAAIKMIKAQALAATRPEQIEQTMQRFQREAQVTASLRSPHTVELYDFGVTADHTFYYVMELLQGLDCSNLVKQHGPLPAERAVYLLRQACPSLREAHARGLLHRDIKPANLYVCRIGLECDFVKVLDFGLVKQFAEDRTEASLTAEGMICGTPAFIAPELALNRGPVDGRADVYALGCVAYWLLTGQLVFESGSPMKMVMDHVHTPPVPPSRRGAAAIPNELDEVVMACLAKRPADRVPSMEELDRRLAAVPLAAPWTAERAAQWWDVHLPETRAAPTTRRAEKATPP